MSLLSFLSSLFRPALGSFANPVGVSKSPITLDLIKRLDLTSANNLLRHDRARARALKNRAFGKNRVPANVPLTNQASLYVASVGIGSPATFYSLAVDRGSSNTWVGAKKPYKLTTTSKCTDNLLTLVYGSAIFSGQEYIDTITIAPGMVIPGQSIGAASMTHGLKRADGILGLGPVGLTAGTLRPARSSVIPTLTDNLFKQGTIPANLIGIFFAPTTLHSVINGQITWGGIDTSKITGSIMFSPITKTSPANKYWGIDQSISYGTTSILSLTAGIVDTGCTLTLVATDAYEKYKKATGAIYDEKTELLCITPAQFQNLRSLFFSTNGVTYELTPNAQIWPRYLNKRIGGKADRIYLIVGDLGRPSGSGLDFINGYTFLERFYSVYDTTNKRVGLATTSFTYATTN